jgi:hypothetical protein
MARREMEPVDDEVEGGEREGGFWGENDFGKTGLGLLVLNTRRF